MLTDIERERLKALNILLVDDSSIARKQLSDALDSINIPYQVCNNGLEALDLMRSEAAQGNPVNLLVSDIEMPGLDGYELSFEIQSDGGLSNAYIILHTSLSSEICVERAKQVGAHEALEKFNAGDLIKLCCAVRPNLKQAVLLNISMSTSSLTSQSRWLRC